jgi:hypothetical protein
MTANTRKKNEPFLSWFKKQVGRVPRGLRVHGVKPSASGKACRHTRGPDVRNRMPSRRALALLFRPSEVLLIGTQSMVPSEYRL